MDRHIDTTVSKEIKFNTPTECESGGRPNLCESGAGRWTWVVPCDGQDHGLIATTDSKLADDAFSMANWKHFYQ